MLHTAKWQDKIIYNYGKGNYDAMKTELGGINWQSELDKEAYDINKQWTYIKEKIQEAVKHHIPSRKVNTNQIKKKTTTRQGVKDNYQEKAQSLAKI